MVFKTEVRAFECIMSNSYLLDVTIIKKFEDKNN